MSIHTHLHLRKGKRDTTGRHETPETTVNDKIRAEMNAGHRFGSFAGERPQNFVKWHIKGHDYFYALSEMLESARECIFIQDWWLSPELYLRRPPAKNAEWRLDRILKRKAEQGVKICVAVYQERALEALHPNIACMRHPNHIGTKDVVKYWSHHEKVVVVDNHRACIGGLDICFGRWDTQNQPLADAHPTDFSRTIFPGQDFNNDRITDYHNVSDYVNENISVLESPRMPWQDVHMTIDGPVVLDIVQHFIERWNWIKRVKYKDDKRYNWLAFPNDVVAAPSEAVDGANEKDPNGSRLPSGTCHAQVVRSVGAWSLGISTEHSIQNAYIQMIREAEHFIYIGTFISNTKETGPVKNQIASALVERILRAAKSRKKFKVIVVLPELPDNAGDVKNVTTLKTIIAAQYRTINRGGSSIYEEIRRAGFEPTDYIRFYNLRVYDRIPAPMNTLIAPTETKSGVKFGQAQAALARQWVYDSVDGEHMPTEVTIKIPSEGLSLTEKTAVKTEKYRIPASHDEAVAIIEKFEHGASALGGTKYAAVSATVGQHALQVETRLADEQWFGTKEEELDAYVSELAYIHSKVMIVDDRRVIMGSANLNDRSQRGDRDSEIALVVEDEDKIPSMMDGQPYTAARFAASLRRKLFRAHLGLIRPINMLEDQVTSFMRPAPVPNDDETGLKEDLRVADPLSDDFLNLWNTTARVNREVFTEVFRPVPCNLVRNWEAYNSYKPKVKVGHVVPGVSVDHVKERLSLVRGSLVEAQIDFLIDQTDFAEGIKWSGTDPLLPIYI
ncbi:hypothetical protein BGW80DRAFT_1436752 [Lactifluus volemus]|nr:hypothetical protein BGW80DRAFT_1436752 [Lactifluus volemus]